MPRRKSWLKPGDGVAVRLGAPGKAKRGVVRGIVFYDVEFAGGSRAWVKPDELRHVSSGHKWELVKDGEVRHAWGCSAGRRGCGTVHIHPDYYAESGTPQCDCDEDREYLHTEVRVRR